MTSRRSRPILQAAGKMALLSVAMFCIVPAPASAETITLGTSKTGFLIWLADANGYFADENVSVEVVEVGSGVVAADRVHKGEITFGTSSEFAFTSKIMDAPGLCIYGTISASRTTRLIARSDRVGPHPRDLASKRIAVTPNGIGQYFLSQYLALSELAEDQVELVPSKPEEIVTRLASGTVDAGMAWEPHVAAIRKALGPIALDYPDQAEQYYYFVLHGRCDLSADKANALRSILRALKRAEQLVEERPDEAKKVIGRRLQLSPETMAEIWPQHSLTLTLTQDLLSVIESQAEWRIAKELSTGPIPDTLDVVRIDPLHSVAPQAVLIHN
ncbi:ABC transporter substrate-binding protein [Thalassobaculum sp.]|uniref:ABC transporter substrate-binding protein n=1 Tax=Thalassobaculum sp. TaxID=2022740 RepID=UPI0032ECF2C2